MGHCTVHTRLYHHIHLGAKETQHLFIIARAISEIVGHSGPQMVQNQRNAGIVYDKITYHRLKPTFEKM